MSLIINQSYHSQYNIILCLCTESYTELWNANAQPSLTHVWNVIMLIVFKNIYVRSEWSWWYQWYCWYAAWWLTGRPGWGWWGAPEPPVPCGGHLTSQGDTGDEQLAWDWLLGWGGGLRSPGCDGKESGGCGLRVSFEFSCCWVGGWLDPDEVCAWAAFINFLYLLRRFWNHIFTCVCVRPREAANSALSGRAKYCVRWKRRFSCCNCRDE